MKKYAFFDVDGTLINTKSMMSFINYYWSNRKTNSTIKRFINCKSNQIIFNTKQLIANDRSKINEVYYELFKGFNVKEIKEMCHEWYDFIKETDDNLFINDVINILMNHKNNGVEPVFVSGSFIELLEPIAEDLGVKHILATRLKKNDEKYTGKFYQPQMIGGGKAIAIMDFIEQNSIDPDACYAYGDHHTDIPMLSTVGKATVINADIKLHHHAIKNNWNIKIAA
ncbi:Phosphoserine phosphatase [hydrothermal vent metagenome]|uniref:Phosphoserine phosphatase n=1 Tax=hydrothermal vent metagenome TaxID=652676 RepID=A0A3B0XQF5_9ZZZZ